MIRRMLVPLVASGLLLAATAGSALAKCEGPEPPDFCSQVMASLDAGGGSYLRLTAGTADTINIFVSRAEQPFDADSVTLVFSRIAGGTVLEIPAERGVQGWWHADVTLPDGGGWTVVAEMGVDGVIERQTFETLRVAPAAEAPEAPVATPSQPINPTPPVLPIALLVAGVAAAALVGVGLRGRARRRVTAG